MIKFFNIFSKLDWSTRKTELNFFEKFKVSNAKTEENFFKKISWSQMIQNCLGKLARNGKKKISAADGGFRRHRRRFFSFPCRPI